MDFHGWSPFFLTLLLVLLPAKGFSEVSESAFLSSALVMTNQFLIPQPDVNADPPVTVPQRFSSLRDAILFYEGLHNSGLWQPIEAGALLKRGELHPQVSQLRHQLLLQGDLSPAANRPLLTQQFDVELESALKRFQDRHSLKADGILGPQTRQALNVHPWQRIDQLVLNIHRQQQLNIASQETYIHVNLPEYRLRVYQQGNVLLEMKTIIGKRTRQTPVFSATVRQLIINPGWNVPKSIAFKDIIPRWQQDGDYLQKHNLQVLAGWSTPRTFVPAGEVVLSRLYQGENYQRFWEPPGENNTLGRVKFPLTSDNSIYLHDTLSRHLFDAEKRAFSSGCIRLEHPFSLVDTLIMLSNQWQPGLLDPLFETQETVPVRLQAPIPVHITYWTAWLDEQGELNFSNDPYLRDPVDFSLFQQQQNQQVKQPAVQAPPLVSMQTN